MGLLADRVLLLCRDHFFREGFFERLLYLIFGVADLLPRNQTGLAGLLRIGGIALMVLTLAVRILQLVA